MAVQAVERERQIAAIRAAEFNPSGEFHVIIVDPPWAYQTRAVDPTHRGATPYPTMTVDEIIDFFKKHIEPAAEADAILWLWTTNAFMAEAHRVAEAIGFEVKTILTWTKSRFGTGDWLRGQTEHSLLAVRGKALVTLTNQSTWLRGDVREHSRKPEEFYVLVASLCPGRKCEFFGREQRKGITVIGAEKDRFKRSPTQSGG